MGDSLIIGPLQEHPSKNVEVHLGGISWTHYISDEIYTDSEVYPIEHLE